MYILTERRRSHTYHDYTDDSEDESDDDDLVYRRYASIPSGSKRRR